VVLVTNAWAVVPLQVFTTQGVQYSVFTHIAVIVVMLVLYLCVLLYPTCANNTHDPITTRNSILGIYGWI